jgi:outer membrane protein
MKKTLVLLAALVAPSIAFAQEGARPISLQEALELAKKNAPSMISARGQLRTSASALRVAKWAFNPVQNLQFGYSSGTGGGGSYDADGFFRERPATNWSFSQSYGTLFSVQLWDGGTKINAVRQRSAQVDQAEINELTQSFSVATSVKQQYYLILRNREQLATNTEALKIAETQLQLARVRVNAGAAVASDSLTALGNVLAAQATILTSENAVSNANAQLTRLTASEFPVTAILSDTSDPPPLALSDAELIALAEQGPTVRTSEGQLRLSNIAEKSSKAILWPRVTMSASFGRSNSQDKNGGGFFSGYDFGAGPMNYSWGFNLGLQYTIFDNWARENAILSAKVSVDNAEAQLREARLTARANITTQLGNLRVNEKQIAIQRYQVMVAAENLRIVQRRYELGSGLQIDVTNAQQQLQAARNALTNSRFDIRNTRAAIEVLIGRELPQ